MMTDQVLVASVCDLCLSNSNIGLATVRQLLSEPVAVQSMVVLEHGFASTLVCRIAR
jgi:hypothetical protein